MLPKLPLKSLPMRTFIEMLVKKYWSKTTCPKHHQTFSFKKRPYWNCRQKVPCEGAVQNTGKNFLHGKDCIELLFMNFCTQTLLRTPSTTSKHSSEKYRTKVLPTTLSMKRNQKTTESKCSSKCYRREMLPKLPLKSLSIRTFIEMLVKKYWSKTTCPKHHQTFSFKKRPYWISRQKVPREGAVQNTGKSLLPGKDCIELLVMNYLYGNLAEDAIDNI